MKTIRSKKKSLEGYVLGVEFQNGEAQTDAPAALAFFGASDDFEVVDSSKTPKASADNGAS